MPGAVGIEHQAAVGPAQGCPRSPPRHPPPARRWVMTLPLRTRLLPLAAVRVDVAHRRPARRPRSARSGCSRHGSPSLSTRLTAEVFETGCCCRVRPSGAPRLPFRCSCSSPAPSPGCTRDGRVLLSGVVTPLARKPATTPFTMDATHASGLHLVRRADGMKSPVTVVDSLLPSDPADSLRRGSPAGRPLHLRIPASPLGVRLDGHPVIVVPDGQGQGRRAHVSVRIRQVQ